MKIIEVDAYFDGGTFSIKTDEGAFFIEGRHSKEAESGFVYNQYPGDKGSELIPEQGIIRKKLISALKEWSDPGMWSEALPKLIERLGKQ